MAVELWTSPGERCLYCHYSAKRRIFQAFRRKKGEILRAAFCGQAVDKHCGKMWKNAGIVERGEGLERERAERGRSKASNILKTGRLSTTISTMWIKLSKDLHISTVKRGDVEGGESEKVAFFCLF